MKVSITQAEVQQGKRRSKRCCPVALAIERTRPGSDPVVHGCYVSLCDDGVFKGRCVWLGREVAARVSSYDEGHPMEPFDFELDLDCPVYFPARPSVETI